MKRINGKAAFITGAGAGIAKSSVLLFAFVSCVVGYWLTWTPAAIAQSKYPDRPIRVLVGFPAAGATDTIARTIGEQLSKQIGWPVVIDNRTGAGGRLATEMLTGAEPDGYTLLIGTVSLAINPSLHKKLSYDVERDLLPLTRLAEIINVMVVNSSTGVVDIKGFIGWAKKRSDVVRFASSGVGQTGHLAGELFQRLSVIRMMHVSYKGSGPALIDLISGDIQVMFPPYGVALPHIKSGRLHALAVATPTRQPMLPNLPTVAETLPGFEFSNWNGMFAPKKTPWRIADRLVAEINKAIQDPEVRKRQNSAGIEPGGSLSREEFAKFIREDTERWAKIIKDANIKVE